MNKQNNYKKFIAYLFILFFSVTGLVYAINQVQITNEGGKTDSEDGVTISKEISSTDTENFFDITLTVKTQTKIEEIISAQDVAVVVVMDISNTMNDPWSAGSSEDKIVSARNAANRFLTKFYEAAAAAPKAARKIGFVTFNKDSQEVFGLSECNDKDEYNKLKNDIDDIVAPTSTSVYWTNMEAGLSRAKDMLSMTTIKNKYIIFITDGLPTSYSQTANGYIGYYPQSTYPYPSSFTVGKFYNFVSNSSVWGVNYSDYAARRAEEVAYEIKKSGTKIYSIGVGISNGSTLYSIINDRNGIVFDSDTEANNYLYYSTQSPYKSEGGRYFALVPGVQTSYSSATATEKENYYNNTIYYQTWLQKYVGSNEYYDSTAAEQLEAAYKDIFADITEMSESATAATWVALDPMNTEGSTTNIEFVGIYDDNNILHNSIDISNDNQSDTAFYSTSTDSISWDLKKSTYKEEKNGNTTLYSYEVKYRVRLENEKNGFKESKIYNTNGTTTLTYVVRNNGVLTDNKELNFKIPSVKGYVGEFEFYKKSSYTNNPLEAAKFELVHDENCPCQKAYLNVTNKNVIIEKQESVSAKDGKVAFSNIPSGHTYILKETKAAIDHEQSKKEYKVIVSYDKVTHDIPDNIFYNDIQKGSLTIKKVVEGNDTYSGDFKFKLVVKYKNKVIKDEIITLKRNETIMVSDLPVGATYTITETTTDGFKVYYNVNQTGEILGDTATCNQENSCRINTGLVNTVTFTNVASYILPATGSSGMLILVIVGTLLLMSPIIYIIYTLLKKRSLS